jgi:hypothetical protein
MIGPRTTHTTTTTATTLPCPCCGGQLQQHATGAGQLLRPSYIDRGYTVFDQTRAADVEAPAVIWTCNGCEACATDGDVQDAIGGAR